MWAFWLHYSSKSLHHFLWQQLFTTAVSRRFRWAGLNVSIEAASVFFDQAKYQLGIMYSERKKKKFNLEGLSFGMTDLSSNYISPKHGRQNKWVVTRFDKKTQNGRDSFILRLQWRSHSFQRENKERKHHSVNETCYLNMIKDNNMISDVKLCGEPVSTCFFSSSKCKDKHASLCWQFYKSRSARSHFPAQLS